MSVYRPNTYQVNTGSVVDRTQGLRQALGDVGSLYQSHLDSKRLDLQEKRQAEQDAMRKAEYDLRMGEAQRAISQRDLLNTVGRESARQVQPHLLAQNQPLLERLNTGTVEGWKAYEQEVASKDDEVASLLARRDAFAKDRAAGKGEAQFSKEESDLLRSKILGYKTKGGDTVQSLATGAYESYVPVKEDASNFMLRRLLDAGVDIDSASDYVKRATEGYKDRATLTAEGLAARDAAIKSDEARVKNELDKAKLLAGVNKDYSGVLGRTVSQGMSVDSETGMITGVRRSGARKGEPFSISAKDITVYDVLESYPDYVGRDSSVKKSINTLLDEKYSKVPENIKAAAVKHSIEDASGWFDNKVDVNTDRLQATLDNYMENYSRTGSIPSFESGVLKEAERNRNALMQRIESINPRSGIPMAMTAEQVRDSAPLNRLKAFLGNVREPERAVQQSKEETPKEETPREETPKEETPREEVLSTVAGPVQRKGDYRSYVIPTLEELAAMGRRPRAGNAKETFNNTLSKLEELRSRVVNQPESRLSAPTMPRLVNNVPSLSTGSLPPEEMERLSRFLLDSQNR